MPLTPDALVEKLKSGPPASVYLFLGAEAYRRKVCRRKLIERALPEGEREAGVTRHDLDSVSLTEVVDDACSLSLFAPNRVIWAASAESAVPRAATDDAAHPGRAILEQYIGNPTPGVVLVVEASRYELEGEGSKRAERVRKFFSPIPDRQVVEFAPYTPAEALRLTRELVRRGGLQATEEATALLAESTGHDAGRIAMEIEKLLVYAGEGGSVGTEEIAKLVPSSRAATIFELVAALGRGDRRTALSLLDTLLQEGEYLPLALSFLETQFRQALVVREQGLKSAREVESYFQKSGVRMWPRKAQEVRETAAAFNVAQLKSAIYRIHRADVALRDARPDDRTVMENLVLTLGGRREG
jgi:DNA polymerase-3 subunit delta